LQDSSRAAAWTAAVPGCELAAACPATGMLSTTTTASTVTNLRGMPLLLTALVGTGQSERGSRGGMGPDDIGQDGQSIVNGALLASVLGWGLWRGCGLPYPAARRPSKQRQHKAPAEPGGSAGACCRLSGACLRGRQAAPPPLPGEQRDADAEP